MSNMAYCRFQNTEREEIFQELLEAANRVWNKYGASCEEMEALRQAIAKAEGK